MNLKELHLIASNIIIWRYSPVNVLIGYMHMYNVWLLCNICLISCLFHCPIDLLLSLIRYSNMTLSNLHSTYLLFNFTSKMKNYVYNTDRSVILFLKYFQNYLMLRFNKTFYCTFEIIYAQAYPIISLPTMSL